MSAKYIIIILFYNFKGKIKILIKKNHNHLQFFSIHWLRGMDLNQRPSGYEPDELPAAPPRDMGKTMAEEKGFEPLRRLHDLPVFKTGPFNQTWVFLRLVLVAGIEPAREFEFPQDFKSCASTCSATQA